MVRRIEDADGQVLQEFAPQERGRLDLKPSTRETVLKGLHGGGERARAAPPTGRGSPT